MPVSIKSWLTTNETRVLYVHRPEIPMMEINIVFNAGSSRDNDQYGLSHLTNMMLKQGTKKFNTVQVAEHFEKVGARFYTSVDRDTAIVGMMSLIYPQYLEPACRLFYDVLSEPAFTKDAFEVSREMVLAALKQQEDMPHIIARNILFSNLYHKHGYAHSILGTPQSISALSVTDVRHFYKKYYSARNAVITLVGDIDRKKAKSITEKLSQQLPLGKYEQPITIVPFTKSKQLRTFALPAKQTHFLMGQVAVNYDDNHYLPLVLGSEILGGSSLASRLFKEVREKNGLTYNIVCRLLNLRARGPIIINFSSNNVVAKKALELTQTVLTRFIEQGPTKNELMIIKRKIINGFPFSISSNNDISQLLLKLAIYQLPLDYLDTYCDKLNAITVTQVKKSVAEFLQLSRMVTVIVGNLR